VKYKAANFHPTRSSLLTSVAIMSFQTGETYCNLDLTQVKYDDNKPTIAENEKVNVCTSANISSDQEHNVNNMMAKTVYNPK
jgi:hypothetical protein